ncbi:MAG: glycosyltransferase family 4 protein [bacterium]
MKIIWVKAGGLVPLDSGGKIRSFHIAKELAKSHEVTLFTFYVGDSSDEHEKLTSVFAKVVTHPLTVSTGRGIAETFRYLATFLASLPYSITKYCRPEVAHHLEEVLAGERYHVILCDFVNAAGVIPFGIGIPVVIFTHNVEATIWKRHWEVATNPVWKYAFKREYERMRTAELGYLRRATHVLTVSDTDTTSLRRDLGAAKITTIPTGVDVDYFRPVGGEEADSLVFTGSMDWMPNEDGILHFVEHVLPLIRKKRPNVKLCVAGRNPGNKIKALSDRDACIEVTGRVGDIRKYIAKGSVFVVPLRVGSGTRLKIFEAMAMGKAVVSTTIGAEGLPVTSGAHIILADEPNEFAASVCRLLASREERARIGNTARRLMEEKYSWEEVAKSVESVLRSVSSSD